MANIIAVNNQKGGVGKTTMAVHIAAGLATLGYQVALVDTDSQGNAALLLGMTEENGLFNLLVEKHPIEDVVRPVPAAHYSTPEMSSQGSLYLLPSFDKTYKIPHELQPDETLLFLEVLEDFAEKAALDVIIIDTNPTLSMFDGSIYLAADGFIYVTECERLSFAGIDSATHQIQRASKSRQRYLGRTSEIVGIIPNKVRSDTVLHRHNIAELAKRYPGLVWSPIRQRIAWAESANFGEPIYIYSPTGEEADDAWRVTKLAEGALKAWQAKTV